MSRLTQMRKYLAEALKEPEENKLYIADLYLSIAYFEKAERDGFPKTKPIEVSSGFALAN